MNTVMISIFWFYLHSLSTLFAIHFPILFKSSFTISITKHFYLLFSLSITQLSIIQLSIVQPSITQLFYYSALLLSYISTSINTLDFHL